MSARAQAGQAGRLVFDKQTDGREACVQMRKWALGEEHSKSPGSDLSAQISPRNHSQRNDRSPPDLKLSMPANLNQIQNLAGSLAAGF